MILLYIFIPIVIWFIPSIWSSINILRREGYKYVLVALIPTIVVFLGYSIDYLTQVVVGGEINLPIQVIALRGILALPFTVFYMVFVKAIFKFRKKLEEKSEIHDSLYAKVTYTTILFIIHIIYSMGAVIVHSLLPKTFSIAWFKLIVDLAALFAFPIAFLSLFYLYYILTGKSISNSLAVYMLVILLTLAVALVMPLLIGAPGATTQGYPFLLIPILLSTTFILIYIKISNGFRTQKIKSMAILSLIVISLLTVSTVPMKAKGKIDDAWNNPIGFNIEINSTKFPIDVINVRLVDRGLASDFAESYRLPKIGKYRLDILEEYENIGLVDGKPAWILPVKYSYAFTPEINYMVGYLYIHLDTPTFESMKFVNKVMKVAPGLQGKANIKYFALSIIPDGMVGEMYLMDPSPATSSPAWVVLIDKYTPWGVRVPYKVLIVGADGDYRVYSWREAINIVPQAVSYKSLKSIIDNIGSSIRNGEKDYFAKGFIWIPASQDIQDNLYSSFYSRPHHFLLGDTWGRDYYTAIRTSGGEESVAVWILINNTLTMFDLRYYAGIGGITRGVNAPEKALETMKKIISQKAIYGAQVRYPKLYRIQFNETTYLIWVALVVQILPAADKPLGVVWVDASNPRLSGFVQYVYGENHDIFMSRLHDNIYASYKGWKTGNETTLITTTINGTILRKNWALLQPDNQYAIIMQIRNQTGEIVTVIVLETKTATKQDFYNAVVANEGDKILIEARWDIELQAWVAYTVQIIT